MAAGSDRRSIQGGLQVLQRIHFRFPSRDRTGLWVIIYSCPKLPSKCRDVRTHYALASANIEPAAGTCKLVVDTARMLREGSRKSLRPDHWYAAVLAHELTHCAGHRREDDAVKLGELWVGRRLGDQRIVREALRQLPKIDAAGHWKN